MTTIVVSQIDHKLEVRNSIKLNSSKRKLQASSKNVPSLIPITIQPPFQNLLRRAASATYPEHGAIEILFDL